MTQSEFFRGERAVDHVYNIAQDVAKAFETATVERQRHTDVLDGETTQGKQKTHSTVTIAFPETSGDDAPRKCKRELAHELRDRGITVDGEPLDVFRYLPHTVDVEIPDARTPLHKR